MIAETFDIVIRGRMGDMILDELEGFTVVETSDGATLLRGLVPDQARLIGVLEFLRGFNVEIEAVRHVGGSPG